MGRYYRIDKDLVQARFSQKVASYDELARPQLKVVELLHDLLKGKSSRVPPGKILEIGSGTGFFSSRLVREMGGRHYFFNDLCSEMKNPLFEKLPQGGCYYFSAYDAESNPWGGPYAMIASSSCIQWWEEPLNFLSRSYDSLLSEGLLLFSTYGPKNLLELQLLGLPHLQYYSLDELENKAQELGYESVEFKEVYITEYFSSFLEVLRHLKGTGVNAIASPRIWTSGEIHRLERLYRERSACVEGQLPLTYHAIIGSAYHP